MGNYYICKLADDIIQKTKNKLVLAFRHSFRKSEIENLDFARHLRSYQLEFDGWSQLQISVDNGRIVQTEHHGIEDSLI